MNSKSNLLVNESASIAPQKQSSQSNHQTMTEQGKQMVFYNLKENPDSCRPTEKSCRYLLVPPQEHISSCTTKTIPHEF
uniref:24 kDa seed maturation protein n=1 Tax=Solanum tuberosum TaxID=4113 RepID=M1AWU1_SOLTU